jgi:putative ABC transport system permease protein
MTLSLTYASLAWAAIFVGFVVIISKIKDYRLIRENVIAVIKMIVQLLIMGFILVGIIDIAQINNPLSQVFVWTIIVVMLLNAVNTTAKRGKGIPRIHRINALGIVVGSFCVLAVLFLAGVAQYTVIGLIPFVGSIVGNTLTKNSQGLERLIAEFRARLPEIETVLALGGTIKQATSVIDRKTMQAIFIPMNDSMSNAGFFLPGAAVGLIITGVPPMEAMIFQCIMFVSWTGSTIISATIINSLALQQLVTRNQQINYDVLRSLVPISHTHSKENEILKHRLHPDLD